MRPYQIEAPNGPWVDLDTIQSITPPYFLDQMGHGGFFIVLRWRHAFQNEPAEMRWTQKWFMPPGALRRTEPEPERDISGDPTELVRVRKEVYEGFLQAWMNPPLTQQPETYRWRPSPTRTRCPKCQLSDGRHTVGCPNSAD